MVGNKRLHTALVTIAGTTTDNGDSITAAALGLHTVENLVMTSPAVDNVTTVATAYAGRFIPVAGNLTGRLVFFGTNAAPGAAVADPEITAGTSLANYSFNCLAYGT